MVFVTRRLGAVSIGAVLALAACQGPEEFFRGLLDGGVGLPPLGGQGGGPGAAGTTGGTGTGGTMVTGTAGTTTGAAGSGSGAAGAAGTGPAGAGGRGGAAGTGPAGAGGRGGAAGTGTAGVGGAAGTGTTGAGGRGGAAGTGTAGAGGRGGAAGGPGGRGGATGVPATVLFSDNFEDQTAGSTEPDDWSRSGGSSGDWMIATDGTQVLRQDGATSSTVRTMHASGASGAPWTGAASAAARVKMIATGSSGQMAMVCVRYADSSNYYCAALVPNGVQIRAVVAGAASQSAVFTSNVAIGTWYDVKISVDAAGLLTAYLGNTMMGTFDPGNVASGFGAVGTISMRAAFDNFVVTRP